MFCCARVSVYCDWLSPCRRRAAATGSSQLVCGIVVNLWTSSSSSSWFGSVIPSSGKLQVYIVLQIETQQSPSLQFCFKKVFISILIVN